MFCGQVKNTTWALSTPWAVYRFVWMNSWSRLCLCLSPVQVVDQALAVVGGQLAQQLLVFPVQGQVIRDGEGLQGETGERFHQLVAVQMYAEIVSCLHSPCWDTSVL